MADFDLENPYDDAATREGTRMLERRGKPSELSRKIAGMDLSDSEEESVDLRRTLRAPLAEEEEKEDCEANYKKCKTKCKKVRKACLKRARGTRRGGKRTGGTRRGGRRVGGTRKGGRRGRRRVGGTRKGGRRGRRVGGTRRRR